MLLRLEIESHGQRKGIYQYSSWITEDYCADCFRIPVPELFKNEDELEEFQYEYGNVSCWFTEKGFRDFGIWFGNLLCNKIASQYFSKEDVIIYVGVMNTKDKHTIVYEDNYQVVFVENDLWEEISQFKPIKTKEDWFKLIESFLPKDYCQSIYSATGWK